MADTTQTVYDFEALSIDGRTHPLAEHRGKVLLIVNTASACGFTPQFAGLEKLVESRNGKKGLGFGSELHSPKDLAESITEVMPEDLMKFGLIPEFIGRLPVITTVTPLAHCARTARKNVGSTASLVSLVETLSPTT